MPSISGLKMINARAIFWRNMVKKGMKSFPGIYIHFNLFLIPMGFAIMMK